MDGLESVVHAVEDVVPAGGSVRDVEIFEVIGAVRIGRGYETWTSQIEGLEGSTHRH